jgi:hypothetical protein
MADLVELFKDYGLVVSKLRYHMLENGKGRGVMAKDIKITTRALAKLLAGKSVSEKTLSRVIKYLGMQ